MGLSETYVPIFTAYFYKFKLYESVTFGILQPYIATTPPGKNDPLSFINWRLNDVFELIIYNEKLKM